MTAQAETKTKIIKKARKLMWYQGYNGTSLNQVVDKAGVSKGAFFHYYNNKEAISRDVLNQYVEEILIAPLDKALAQNHSVKNALFDWLSSLFEAFKTHDFKGGCLLGNLALELSDTNDTAREDIKAHFLTLENRLTAALRPLNNDGKLLFEYRQLARLILASMQGIFMMGRVHKDNNRASREFQAMAQMIEYTIKD